MEPSDISAPKTLMLSCIGCGEQSIGYEAADYDTGPIRTYYDCPRCGYRVELDFDPDHD